MLIAAPTNEGQTLTIAYWPSSMFHDVRDHIERHFLAALELVPDLAERIHAGERAERYRGSAQLNGYFRRLYGPGWALVGDAGYHKNPVTAEGITDAFRDAELLAGALAGLVPEPDALAAYERRRNEVVMPIYEMTAQFATLEPPPPEMQQLFRALLGNQAQVGRFLGTIAGTVSIPAFYSPENLGSLMAGAPA